MNITLKTCTVEDIHTLREISYETFDESFREQNTAEAMEAYLEEAFTLQKLDQELRNPFSHFFFAYIDGQIAGYLKLNTGNAQTEDMGEDALEVERIYIKKNYQKHGIGNYLINQATSIAKEKQKNKIWLGVWEKNDNALAFYKKMGFIQTGSHSFFMGDEEQTDFLMTKVI
ncbi:GNAT family N-acetyltransferase [Gracilibacillus sp. S3-1-1]|uniref:GNAT family N-acetyltransferase n=1 Tax=Gracilibacillus pellucidus TaxID=3095368 RepID=A0ACC6M852_9BACI|nr:GNAT family N-acetyltransferase [Gracilibacillus sp. S3-1-1]MDX8047166.1 GNAT family N-acetyltransferase [Gracilibacillus sp. S3-1-1]